MPLPVARINTFFLVAFCILTLQANAASAESGDQSLSYYRCEHANLPSSWTHTERWTWEQLCDNDNADLSQLSPKADHSLSEVFLENIVEEEPYKDLLTGPIGISHAIFTDTIELDGDIIERPLWLEYCNFYDDVDMHDMHAPELSFYGSHFKKGVNLSDSSIDGPVSFVNATIRGPLQFENSVASKYFDLTNAHLGGSFSLSHARIGGQLQLTGSFIDKASFSAATIASDVNAQNVHWGSLTAVGAEIGGQFFVQGCHIPYGIAAFSLTVGKEFVFRDCPIVGNVDLRLLNSSSTGEFRNVRTTSLNLRGAKFAGELTFFGASVAKECDGSRVHAGGTIFLQNTTFLSNCGWQYASTTSNFEIKNGSYSLLDLTGLQVGGDFYIDSVMGSIWRGTGRLILRNATAHDIEDRDCANPPPTGCADPWPGELDLTGFHYDGLGALDRFARWSAVSPNAQALNDPFNMADRDLKFWNAWLAHSPFDSGVYEQLASVLTQSGHRDTAQSVLFDEKWQELMLAPFPEKLFLFFDCAFVGFGIYPYYSAYWIVGLLIAGVIVLHRSGEYARIRSKSSEVEPFPLGGIVYSFDLLIPVITLRKNDEEIDLRGAARSYFYAHRLIGFVLASFLIAALTGLTK